MALAAFETNCWSPETVLQLCSHGVATSWNPEVKGDWDAGPMAGPRHKSGGRRGVGPPHGAGAMWPAPIRCNRGKAGHRSLRAPPGRAHSDIGTVVRTRVPGEPSPMAHEACTASGAASARAPSARRARARARFAAAAMGPHRQRKLPYPAAMLQLPAFDVCFF